MKEQMIAYLQEMMDDYKAERAVYGFNDRMVERKWERMYACKKMVEALIGEPIKCGIDGIVTVGEGFFG